MGNIADNEHQIRQALEALDPRSLIPAGHYFLAIFLFVGIYGVILLGIKPTDRDFRDYPDEAKEKYNIQMQSLGCVVSQFAVGLAIYCLASAMQSNDIIRDALDLVVVAVLCLIEALVTLVILCVNHKKYGYVWWWPILQVILGGAFMWAAIRLWISYAIQCWVKNGDFAGFNNTFDPVGFFVWWIMILVPVVCSIGIAHSRP